MVADEHEKGRLLKSKLSRLDYKRSVGIDYISICTNKALCLVGTLYVPASKSEHLLILDFRNDTYVFNIITRGVGVLLRSHSTERESKTGEEGERGGGRAIGGKETGGERRRGREGAHTIPQAPMVEAGITVVAILTLGTIWHTRTKAEAARRVSRRSRKGN